MKSKIEKRYFKTNGDDFNQSKANHEHPNELLNILDEDPQSIGEVERLFQQMIEAWYVRLKRLKAYKEKGYTFLIHADCYSICTVSVMAGDVEWNYGGREKRFYSIKQLLKAYVKESAILRRIKLNELYIVKSLQDTGGDLAKASNVFEIPSSTLKRYILNDLYPNYIKDYFPEELANKIFNSAEKVDYMYSIHYLKTLANQESPFLSK